MVFFSCLFDRLIACLIIQTCIELFSALSCSDHMNDAIVTTIANHRNIAAQIIHKTLPKSIRDVRTSIEQASIVQDYDVLISDHPCNLQKLILQAHLKLHQCLLKHKSLLLCECVADDHRATFHQ